MDRRKVLLPVAAVIAALGTLLVFLYVRGADTRADERYEAVQVLRVVKQIAAGRDRRGGPGRGQVRDGLGVPEGPPPRRPHRHGAVAGKVAVSTIYPGEQLISSKFGATGAGQRPDHPQGQDRDLDQPVRPRPGRRLREPRVTRSRSSCPAPATRAASAASCCPASR